MKVVECMRYEKVSNVPVKVLCCSGRQVYVGRWKGIGRNDNVQIELDVASEWEPVRPGMRLGSHQISNGSRFTLQAGQWEHRCFFYFLYAL